MLNLYYFLKYLLTEEKRFIWMEMACEIPCSDLTEACGVSSKMLCAPRIAVSMLLFRSCTAGSVNHLCRKWNPRGFTTSSYVPPIPPFFFKVLRSTRIRDSFFFVACHKVTTEHTFNLQSFLTRSCVMSFSVPYQMYNK